MYFETAIGIFAKCLQDRFAGSMRVCASRPRKVSARASTAFGFSLGVFQGKTETKLEGVAATAHPAQD
jgi:hypothetical protein